MEKTYMDSAECGKYIGRSAGAVRNLVMRRAIPFRKAGGRLIFIQSEIDEWILMSPGTTIDDLAAEWIESRPRAEI